MMSPPIPSPLALPLTPTWEVLQVGDDHMNNNYSIYQNVYYLLYILKINVQEH